MVVKVPGSKGRYLRLLDPYLDWLVDGETEFADVCVGGGSVLVHIAERYPSLQLLANDVDPLIAAFWQVVVHPELMEALCAKLAVPPTRELRAQFLSNEPTDLLDQAYAIVVLSRTSRSGYLRAKMFNGGRDQTCLRNLLEHWSPKYMVGEIHRYHSLLAGRLTVFQQRAVDFLDAHHGTPLFVDPPYVGVGHRLYRFFPSQEEHEALASGLQQCRKSIATYDDCEPVRRWFQGGECDLFPVRYSADRTPRHNYRLKQRSELVIATYRGASLPTLAGGRDCAAVHNDDETVMAE